VAWWWVGSGLVVEKRMEARGYQNVQGGIQKARVPRDGVPKNMSIGSII
jgi:hypothetical protein